MFGLAPQPDQAGGVPRQTIGGFAIRHGFGLVEAIAGCWLLSFGGQNDLHNALKLVSARVTQRLCDPLQLGMLLPGYIPVEHQAAKRVVFILEVFILIFQFHEPVRLLRWNYR